MTTNSVTITFSVENTARADVMLSNSRVYYRFATVDTCEEGEMPCSETEEIIDKITQSINDGNGEPMPIDVKCIVTIIHDDGAKTTFDNSSITLASYNALINILSHIGNEFMFVWGFK